MAKLLLLLLPDTETPTTLQAAIAKEKSAAMAGLLAAAQHQPFAAVVQNFVAAHREVFAPLWLEEVRSAVTAHQPSAFFFPAAWLLASSDAPGTLCLLLKQGLVNLRLAKNDAERLQAVLGLTALFKNLAGFGNDAISSSFVQSVLSELPALLARPVDENSPDSVLAHASLVSLLTCVLEHLRLAPLAAFSDDGQPFQGRVASRGLANCCVDPAAFAVEAKEDWGEDDWEEAKPAEKPEKVEAKPEKVETKGMEKPAAKPVEKAEEVKPAAKERRPRVKPARVVNTGFSDDEAPSAKPTRRRGKKNALLANFVAEDNRAASETPSPTPEAAKQAEVAPSVPQAAAPLKVTAAGEDDWDKDWEAPAKPATPATGEVEWAVEEEGLKAERWSEDEEWVTVEKGGSKNGGDWGDEDWDVEGEVAEKPVEKKEEKPVEKEEEAVKEKPVEEEKVEEKPEEVKREEEKEEEKPEEEKKENPEEMKEEEKKEEKPVEEKEEEKKMEGVKEEEKKEEKEEKKEEPKEEVKEEEKPTEKEEKVEEKPEEEVKEEKEEKEEAKPAEEKKDVEPEAKPVEEKEEEKEENPAEKMEENPEEMKEEEKKEEKPKEGEEKKEEVEKEYEKPAEKPEEEKTEEMKEEAKEEKPKEGEEKKEEEKEEKPEIVEEKKEETTAEKKEEKKEEVKEEKEEETTIEKPVEEKEEVKDERPEEMKEEKPEEKPVVKKEEENSVEKEEKEEEKPVVKKEEIPEEVVEEKKEVVKEEEKPEETPVMEMKEEKLEEEKEKEENTVEKEQKPEEKEQKPEEKPEEVKEEVKKEVKEEKKEEPTLEMPKEKPSRKPAEKKEKPKKPKSPKKSPMEEEEPVRATFTDPLRAADFPPTPVSIAHASPLLAPVLRSLLAAIDANHAWQETRALLDVASQLFDHHVAVMALLASHVLAVAATRPLSDPENAVQCLVLITAGNLPLTRSVSDRCVAAAQQAAAKKDAVCFAQATAVLVAFFAAWREDCFVADLAAVFLAAFAKEAVAQPLSADTAPLMAAALEKYAEVLELLPTPLGAALVGATGLNAVMAVGRALSALPALPAVADRELTVVADRELTVVVRVMAGVYRHAAKKEALVEVMVRVCAAVGQLQEASEAMVLVKAMVLELATAHGKEMKAVLQDLRRSDVRVVQSVLRKAIEEKGEGKKKRRASHVPIRLDESKFMWRVCSTRRAVTTPVLGERRLVLANRLPRLLLLGVQLLQEVRVHVLVDHVLHAPALLVLVRVHRSTLHTLALTSRLVWNVEAKADSEHGEHVAAVLQLVDELHLVVPVVDKVLAVHRAARRAAHHHVRLHDRERHTRQRLHRLLLCPPRLVYEALYVRHRVCHYVCRQPRIGDLTYFAMHAVQKVRFGGRQILLQLLEAVRLRLADLAHLCGELESRQHEGDAVGVGSGGVDAEQTLVQLDCV